MSKALELAIENVLWLILIGVEAEQFVFVIESDWSSKYVGNMLFVGKDREEQLVDLGGRVQLYATSSCLDELDALVWACKCTKAFRGMLS